MSIKLPVSSLTNPSSQNNYHQFVQTTAPTQRSPGDRWINPSTKRQGFWQSPYWVSEQEYCVADVPRSLGVTTSPAGTVQVPELNHDNILLEAVAFGTRDSITASVGNTWVVQPRYDASGAVNIPGSAITINSNIDAYTEIVVPLSIPILLFFGCRYFHPPIFTRTGSPSTIVGVCTYKYRLIL